MKKMLIFGAVALCLCASAVQAQSNTTTTVTGTTTNSAVPPAQFLAADIGVSGALGNLFTAVENSDLLQATNWAVAPYATYAPSAADKVGGGLLAVYNVPQLSGSMGRMGTALGADWLGSWSLISANVTIQTDTHPFAHIAWLAAILPAAVTNITMTPIGVAGVGTPMSGSGSAATIWDVGDQFKFGHWLGGQFGVGATWGEWSNAGKEGGHRYHFFASYQWGI